MKKEIIIILILALFFIIGYNIIFVNNNIEENLSVFEYKKITSIEAKEMMENEDVIIIDVREQYEYDDGHIEDSILSPLGNIENDIKNITTDKEDIILIYCRSGNRSATASNKLLDLGYINVYDFGGIIDWEYEIVR